MSLSRRQFLAASIVAPSLLRPGAVRAIDPIKRPSDKPDLKLSLAAYSMRQFLDLKKPTMTLFEFIDFAGPGQLIIGSLAGTFARHVYHLYEIPSGLQAGERVVADGGVFVQFMQSQ